MSREQAIRLAKESGLFDTIKDFTWEWDLEPARTDDLVRFYDAAFKAGVEASAKVIENDCHDDMTRAEEADAIRARGEKP